LITLFYVRCFIVKKEIAKKDKPKNIKNSPSAKVERSFGGAKSKKFQQR